MSLPKIHGIFRIHTKEVKYTQDGTPILNMNVVASDKYKTKAGEEREDVCWITAVSFAKQAEIINQHFHEKGRILIHGSLKQETWEQDGQKRSKHVIKIKEFEFVDAKTQGQQNNQGHATGGGMNNPSSQQQSQYNQNQNPPPAQHLPTQNDNTQGNGYQQELPSIDVSDIPFNKIKAW